MKSLLLEVSEIINVLHLKKGRHGGLLVGDLDYRSRGPGSSPSWRHPIHERVEILPAAQRRRNRDKLQPDERLGLYGGFTYLKKEVHYKLVELAEVYSRTRTIYCKSFLLERVLF